MSKHADEADRIISEGLADAEREPLSFDPEWEAKLQSLKDFEYLAAQAVAHHGLTEQDAQDAICDYIIWMESGDSADSL